MQNLLKLTQVKILFFLVTHVILHGQNKYFFRRYVISETDPVHGSSSKLSFSSFFSKSSICSLEEIDYLLICLLFPFYDVYSSPQKTRKHKENSCTASEVIKIASSYKHVATVYVLVSTTSQHIKQVYLHYFLNEFFLIFRNCYRTLCGIRRNV